MLVVVRESVLLLSFQGRRTNATHDIPELVWSLSYETHNVTHVFKHGDIFDPGTLAMSRLETYHKCYVDPCKYQNHLRRDILCGVSHDYNLTYYMVAKPGSSTCRHAMKESFRGEEGKCDANSDSLYDNNHNDSSSMFHFTSFRDPYSRFISSYQQALVLSFKPGRKIQVPDQYSQSFNQQFENMTMGDYLRLFESSEGRKRLQIAAQDFISDYDAEIPFDGHLRLQVPRLASSKTGRTRRLDTAFDTETLQQDFSKLAEMVHAPTPEILNARSRNHKLDGSDLSRDTKRKICQLSGIDYCCLNYALPEECKDVVKCRWTKNPDNHKKELLIESLSQYPQSTRDCTDQRIS